jgi:hypothetical protein
VAASAKAVGMPGSARPTIFFVNQARLKNWTARSCFFAAALVLKVPRFLRLPVFGFFLREYNRKPDLTFLIMLI